MSHASPRFTNIQEAVDHYALLSSGINRHRLFLSGQDFASSHNTNTHLSVLMSPGLASGRFRVENDFDDESSFGLAISRASWSQLSDGEFEALCCLALSLPDESIDSLANPLS